MRIGFSTSVMQRGKSGVGQYVLALLRAQQQCASSKHHYTLFVLEEDLPLFDFAKETMQIVTVPERYRPAVKNILWHQVHLPRLARRHNLDVLHVPSYRRMLWRRPCATVSTICDLAPFHVAGKYDWMRMFYGRVVVRLLARRQREILAISENTARDINTFFGIERERVTVIHLGVDRDRFFPGPRDSAKADAATRYKLDKPFFLYVARLEHPGKNHVPLIAAFDEFKRTTGSDWQLVFGGSDWHGAEAIHEAIRKSPFVAEIRSLGFVPDERLPELYRAADVFVFPSLFEGFGLPPIEAMACGCPVISSTRGSLGEVVGDAAAIVEPTDVQSIASQLKLFATDPTARERYRAAGFVRAKKFDWTRTASETVKVYERAVKGEANLKSANLKSEIRKPQIPNKEFKV